MSGARIPAPSVQITITAMATGSRSRDDLPSVPASRLVFEALLHLEMADALFLNEPRDIQEHVRVALGLLKLIRESR